AVARLEPCHPPLTDARALHDPLIGGVHELLEVGVSFPPRGQGGADARDLKSTGEQAAHAGSPSAAAADCASMCATSCSRATMCSLTFSERYCSALRMPARMVRGWLEPWAMKNPPLTPSSGAPPCS